MATVESASPRGVERWAALGGILYVVLFIVGNLIAFNDAPTGDEGPARYIAFYGDSGNRDMIALGWGLVLLGLFFFLWFLSAVRQVLRPLDGDGFLTTLATIGGAVYATLTLAGISLWTAIATMSDDTFRDRVYPGLVHAGSDAGYVIHSAGGVGIGAMMIAASLAASRAALIPRWAGIAGIAFGFLALGSLFFFPQALVAIWILVAAWLVYRAQNRPGVPPAPTAVGS